MLFTSESVTEGHPDKVCDRISDAILDEILKNDKNARVACETFCTTGVITVMGEITTSSMPDIPQIVRKTVCDIGYNGPDACFDGNTCAVFTSIDRQSPDIAMGVDNSLEYKENGADKYDLRGAGDQGMMFGYACNETDSYMPMPAYLAHRLSYRLTEVRKKGILDYLNPDGKTQVTVEYEDNKPKRIEAIVVSSQHKESVSLEELRDGILENVIKPIIPENMIDESTKIFINPTGRFVIGGPAGDTGLTGRKIIVDTYGGVARHGGGAFSGKDPTKVDRSASYMARYIAKNVVASGIANRCEVQLAYAIGVAHPVSVLVDTFGTGKIDDSVLADFIREKVDMRPAAIISRFDLRRPIYGDLAAYGHMGREDLNIPWEKRDFAEEIKASFNF